MNTQKCVIALWTLIAAILVFNPVTYCVTNKVFTLLGAPTLTRNTRPLTLVAPTWFGAILHLVVFVLLVRVMMEFKLPGLEDNYCS